MSVVVSVSQTAYPGEKYVGFIPHTLLSLGTSLGLCEFSLSRVIVFLIHSSG